MMALGAFGGVLHNGFVYDDLLIIYANPLFSNQPNLTAIFSSDYFAWSRQGSYRPMVTLSYMLDGLIWGGRPFGFHLTNLLLHLANVLLLFTIARRLGAAATAAFLGAGLFAVHPAFTEVVAFPNYREDLLVLCFSLGAIRFVIGKRADGAMEEKTGLQDKQDGEEEENKENEEKHSAFKGEHLISDHSPFHHSAAPAALLYGCALLSKESGLGLLLFMGLAAIAIKISRKDAFGEKLKIKNLIVWRLFIAVTVLYLFLRFGLYGASRETKPPYLGDSFLLNGFTMCGVAVSYLQLLAFPFHLRAEYAVKPVSSLPEALLSVAGLVVILGAIVMVLGPAGRKRMWAAVGVGWCLAFLAPVMNLHPIAHPKAERYLYLPCAGGFLLAGVGLWWMLGRLKERKRPLAGVGMAMVFICFIGLTRARVEECRDNFRLWKAAARCEPGSDIARQNLGAEYLEQGRPGPAQWQFRQAAELRSSPQSELNLVRAEIALARESGSNKQLVPAREELIRLYRKQLESPSLRRYEQAQLRHGLAVALRQAGQLDEAVKEHERTLELEPLSDFIRLHFGITQQKMGKVKEAVSLYEQALVLFSARAQTHYNRGTALEKLKKKSEAQSAYEQAILLDPAYPEAHAGLGAMLLRQGQFLPAANHLESALMQRPKRKDWRFNYAQALLRSGKEKEGMKQLKALSDENETRR